MRGAKQKEMFAISDLRRREILHLRPSVSLSPGGGGGGGGGGYSDIFIIGTLGLWAIFFWGGGAKFCISIFLGGFQKKILWIFFLGSSQNWTIYLELGEWTKAHWDKSPLG